MRRVDREMENQLRMLSEAMARTNRDRGFRYKSLYEAQRAEGIRFPHKPYTELEREVLLDIFGSARMPWRAKQCFYNAQTLSASDDRLGYAEGYVLLSSMPVPVEHAWAVLGQKPVDVTIRELGAPDRCVPEELLDRAEENLKNSYVGVMVDKDEVRKSWLKTGYSNAMLLLPEILEEVLRRGFEKFGGTR